MIPKFWYPVSIVNTRTVPGGEVENTGPTPTRQSLDHYLAGDHKAGAQAGELTQKIAAADGELFSLLEDNR